MEEFITITMTTKEYQLLVAAAKKARQPLMAWSLETLLTAAEKRTATKEPADPYLRARAAEMVSTYTHALGYSPAPDQHKIMWKAAHMMAKAGYEPPKLPEVLAWMRETDSRWRAGQYCSLTMVMQAWPAFLARSPDKAAGSHLRATQAHDGGVDTLAVFGTSDDLF